MFPSANLNEAIHNSMNRGCRPVCVCMYVYVQLFTDQLYWHFLKREIYIKLEAMTSDGVANSISLNVWVWIYVTFWIYNVMNSWNSESISSLNKRRFQLWRFGFPTFWNSLDALTSWRLACVICGAAWYSSHDASIVSSGQHMPQITLDLWGPDANVIFENSVTVHGSVH